MYVGSEGYRSRGWFGLSFVLVIFAGQVVNMVIYLLRHREMQRVAARHAQLWHPPPATVPRNSGMPCGGLRRSKPEWGDAVVSDPTGTVLSVRGDARRTVAPDYVVLFSTVTVVRESTAQALRVAASAVDRLTADLASLGGVALDVASGRRPLTWSTQSATTSEQGDLNKQTGRYDPTGQVSATVAVVITVREFDMLDSLGAALAAHDALAVQSVG